MHVRKQTGAFGEAFAKLDQDKYKDSICKWRMALEEAANLSGCPYKDGEYEAKFIDDIVGELSARVVNPSCMLHVAAHPVGLESCRGDVNRILDLEENVNVRMVGIWGPGGIGKTTIAKDVYNSIRNKFEGSCFLADVRSNSNGLAQLQEKLLFDVLGDSTLKVSSIDQGVGLIKTRMQRKKALIILDDVSHSSQLQNLVPSQDCFGRGSRVIITTRDKRWLIAHEVDEVYEVKTLKDCQAMNLFSLNAFRTIGPPSDHLELAQRAIRYAQGLPLALIVLGSHLYRRSREEWKATISSCRGDPHTTIQGVLRLSYDALGEDLKEVFLDIACFFKGKYVNNVKPVLQACYDLNSGSGIEQLQEKALLRLDRYEGSEKDVIWMHDLIEEMGKKIANPEGKPGKSTRLWEYDDVERALTDNTGTKKIKGIHLDLWQYRNYEICLNAKSFSKMKNLRYFNCRSYNDIKWSGNIDYLSNELRWLKWYGCPIQSFPSNFHPQKLVRLHISDSPHITRLWDGRKNLPNLKYMDLSNCRSLTELPDFSGIPNLIQLRLYDCKSLVEIHHSIGKMDSLRRLVLSCTGVEELDPSIGNLSGLKELRIQCENLTTLPCSIYDLQNLVILDLSGCSKLVTFPRKESISHDDSGSLVFPKLRVCDISDCNFPIADFIGNLDCLQTLNNLQLSSNNFVTLPGLGKFVNLAKIDLSCCESLREIPELPPNILAVDAEDCESLERFLMLPKSLNTVKMNLTNCHRFSECLGNDMKMMENILLNNQDSRFRLLFPGCEVPKWFQYCSKEFVTIATENGPSSTCAISFEIPSKLKLEYTGGLACSFVGRQTVNADLSINGVHIHHLEMKSAFFRSDHMCLYYIPLSGEIKGKLLGGSPYKCRLEFKRGVDFKCGVHLVCQPPNEDSNKIVMAAEPAGESGMLDWLSRPWSVNPERKRPHTGANDDYHHEQEQQEQPIVMSPLKRHCTEEELSVAPVDDISISPQITLHLHPPDQIFQTSDEQANLDLLPDLQLTLATPGFQ